METADSSLRNISSSRIANLVIPALVVIAVGVNLLAPIFTQSWAQTPFLGLFSFPNLVISNSYNPAWAARQQGINTGDRLLAIDGVAVNNGRTLALALRNHQPGSAVSVTIETTQLEQKTVSLPVANISAQDLMTYFWLPYLVGLLYLGLGLVVYRLRGFEYGSDVFIVFCTSISIMAGGLFDLNSYHLLTPVWALVYPLTGATLMHLAFVFPIKTKLARRQPWLRLIPYVAAIILGLVNVYSFYFSANPRAYLSVRWWDFALIGLAIPVFLALQLNTRFSTLSSVVRHQTALVFGGSVLAFGPMAAWVIANILGFPIPFNGSIFTAVILPFVIFPIITTYAMLRYRLLNLDIVFNRGAVYALLTLLVAVIYFLVVNLLGNLLQDTFLFKNPVVLAVFVLVLVISMEPLKQQLQNLLNRLFQREAIDYQQLLQRYSRALISTPLNTEHIVERLVLQATEVLAAEPALVYLRDATASAFTIRHPKNNSNLHTVEINFGLSDDLAQWLADTNNILQLTPTGEAPSGVRISREELARLNVLNVSLCVPLLGSENLLGWLALGLKKSSQPYSSGDLTYLSTLASQTTIALENAQLLEEANHRAAELETLQKLSGDIQAQTNPDNLLNFVVDRAAQLLNAAGGLVFMLEPNDKTLKVVVSHNLGYDYCNHTVEVPQDVAGRVIMLGQSVVADNYLNLSNRAEAFKGAQFGSVLGTPLRWGGKVRGVLELVHRPHDRRFNEGDIWLMELFATQVAIALEQSRLLQEAQLAAHQLFILSEVSMAISSTLDLDTALERVMNRAVEILHAEAGSLLLMDPQGKELTFEVVLGPTGKELLGVKTQVGKGIVGTVAQTSQPLIINDVSQDARWNVKFDEATEFKTKNLLCVPMLAHDRVVGVIEVINKQDGTVFTPEDSNLLLSFAAQAAIAIENAQIFTRTDLALAERVQDLQMLQMFDLQLQKSLELPKVLDITLTHAMDALGVSMGLMGVIRKEEAEPGLYLLAQRGMPMEMGRYRIDPWPLTRGIMGRVARTGTPELVNDITTAKDYLPKSHRTRSLLVVPVMREEKVIGVLNLESTDPDYFTQEDLSFAQILVSQAAIAIDNARLFDQVKDANRAKSEFMSTASHELKIPMTSIKGYSKLMQMGAAGPLNEKQQDFLTVVSNNVDRMDRLVSDLLDVSRIEAGRIRLEIENVQIADVINDVLASVRTQIEKKNLRLTVNVDDNLPEIRADYHRMVQIITNLVSNAYKYTPEGGSITVSARAHNGDINGIAVTVADTGYGISEEDQAMLFTNFFRASDQNIRNEPGTGLGLSITKRMIESHGGELTFKSQLGKGTAFTVTMPLESKIPPGVEVTRR